MDNTSISIIGENFSKGSSNQFISGGEREGKGGEYTAIPVTEEPQSSPNVNHKSGSEYSGRSQGFSLFLWAILGFQFIGYQDFLPLFLSFLWAILVTRV